MFEKKENSEVFYPSALTIGASDSSGGSGIQADLRTFNAYGIYGCSVLTAVVAQNHYSTDKFMPVPGDVAASQIDMVLKEIAVKFAKSGFLSGAEQIEAVADAVKRHKLFLVCDSAVPAQDKQSLGMLCQKLLPVSKWLTLTVDEAATLVGKKITNIDLMKSAALEIFEKYGCSVVVKAPWDVNSSARTSAVCVKGELFTLKTPAVDIETSSETHGAECTFSAALTAGFAMGMDWKNSLTDAEAFTTGSMREAARIGSDVFAMYPPTEDCRHEIKISSGKKK
ncbi:MAG: bifunctional hydroxymethylpyrimidine kinase/phosphomethylpyrimidine kinase [Lentisphaeria bacterium]|nr:bifunctional hydroxymethylpyrimidine kinase/phosphomethylpyrimidine kinase [Lentisphaeria bacterium]